MSSKKVIYAKIFICTTKKLNSTLQKFAYIPEKDVL